MKKIEKRAERTRATVGAAQDLVGAAQPHNLAQNHFYFVTVLFLMIT